MFGVLARFAVPLITVVLILGGVGLARASLDDLAVAQSLASSPTPLLGPINSLGRSGWDCAPEKAARAATPMRAELLSDQGK